MAMVCSDKPKEIIGNFPNYTLVLPKTCNLSTLLSRFNLIISSIRWHAILIVLLYLLLDYEYRNFVVPNFTHMNFGFSFDLARFITGGCFMLIAVVSLFLLKPTPYLHTLSIAAIALLLIPNIILYQYMPTDIAIPLAMLGFVLLLRIPFREFKFIHNIKPLNEHATLWIISVLAIILLIPVIYDFRFQLPDLQGLLDASEQYNMRDETAHRISLLSHYSLGQLLKTVMPAALLLGIALKRYWLTMAGCFVIAWLFLVYPHKTTLVMLLPLLMFAFIRDHGKQAGYFLLALSFTILFTAVLSRWWNIMPESLLVRRIFFTQAYITHAYTDFFRGAPLWFSHSFMSAYLPYPYALEPAFEIGKVYFGSSEMRCNTGFAGDGFMNMGYAGMYLFTLLTAAMFHFISQLRLKPLFFGLSFLILYQITNTSPVTMLITHGLLVLLIMMVFLLRERNALPYLGSR